MSGLPNGDAFKTLAMKCYSEGAQKPSLWTSGEPGRALSTRMGRHSDGQTDLTTAPSGTEVLCQDNLPEDAHSRGIGRNLPALADRPGYRYPEAGDYNDEAQHEPW